MRTKLLSFLLIQSLFIATTSAQTTLESGDIAVIYHFSETVNTGQGSTANADRIGLILLKDITTNTTFKISENGSNNGTSLEADEGIIIFTAQSDLSAGTIIDIVSLDQLGMGITSNIPSVTDANPGTNYAVATSGDQTMIYTGSESSPTFIYSAFFDGTSWDSSCTGTGGLCSGSQSVEPSSGVTFAFGATGTSEFDNNWYMGPTIFNTPAEALAAITDINNWTGENGNTGAGETAADNLLSNGISLSLDENSIIEKVSMYPNPSTGMFTIANPGVQIKNIQIMDVNGRLIKTVNLQNSVEDINVNLQLRSGMYFVKVTSIDANTTKKLIVN